MKIDERTIFDVLSASWDDSFYLYDLLSSEDPNVLPDIIIGHYIKEHAFNTLARRYFEILDNVMFEWEKSLDNRSSIFFLNIRCHSLPIGSVEITDIDVVTVDLRFECNSLIKGTLEHRNGLLLELMMRVIEMLELEFNTKLIIMRQIYNVVEKKLMTQKLTSSTAPLIKKTNNFF